MIDLPIENAHRLHRMGSAFAFLAFDFSLLFVEELGNASINRYPRWTLALIIGTIVNDINGQVTVNFILVTVRKSDASQSG